MTLTPPLSLLLALNLVNAAPAGDATPAAEAAPFATPEEVWRDFDPRREPLDVAVKRRWTADGAAYQELTFTGETIQGHAVRVYALYAAPEGAKRAPALLHIHGGGQTANPSWLAFWTRRGYAAMTFNWGGRWENRADFTQWGPFVEGNHKDARTGPVVHPNQHSSCWYHWALVSRRCLTFIEQQPEVDPERIGIFGISMGGTLVWPVAAMDRRVKAACAIYGNGWETHPADRTAPDPRADDPDTQLWRRTMQGEAYAPLISCPLLFLSASNDQHGKMDRTDDILRRLRGPAWQAITPNQRHHVAPDQGRSLPLFMDACLRGGPALPANPSTRLGLDDQGVPFLSVLPDAPEAVARVEVYYALERTNPMARYWRPAAALREGDGWRAPLPLLDPRRPLFAFANVFYRSGFSLTSRLHTVVPAEMGAAKATDQPSLLIEDFAGGFSGWVRPASYTDPDRDTTYLRAAVGPGGVPGLAHEGSTGGRVALATRKIGDPKWRGPAGASLSFQVLSGQANEIRVAATENEFVPGMRTYAATVPLAGSPEWQKVTLAPAQLKTEKGEALQEWGGVTCLEITAEGWAGDVPVLSLFHWVR